MTTPTRENLIEQYKQAAAAAVTALMHYHNARELVRIANYAGKLREAAIITGRADGIEPVEGKNQDQREANLILLQAADGITIAADAVARDARRHSEQAERDLRAAKDTLALVKSMLGMLGEEPPELGISPDALADIMSPNGEALRADSAEGL